MPQIEDDFILGMTCITIRIFLRSKNRILRFGNKQFSLQYLAEETKPDDFKGIPGTHQQCKDNISQIGIRSLELLQ